MGNDLSFPKVISHLPAELRPLWLEPSIGNAVRLIRFLRNCLVFLYTTIVELNRFLVGGLQGYALIMLILYAYRDI